MEAGGNLRRTNYLLLRSLETESSPFAFCCNHTLEAVYSRLFIPSCSTASSGNQLLLI